MNDSVTYLMITCAEFALICMGIWFMKQVVCGIRALVKIFMVVEKNVETLNEIENQEDK